VVKLSKIGANRVLVSRYLTFSLAAGLAMVLAGCYTMLQHPLDDLDLRAQDESCSRCHFYDEDGDSAIYYVDDYYVNSDYPWINYYDSNWWTPVRWERYDPAPRSDQRQRGKSGDLTQNRSPIHPRWRPVAVSSEAESLRLSIAHRFINRRITAPASSFGGRMGDIGAPAIIGRPGGGGGSQSKTTDRQIIEGDDELRTRTLPSRESGDDNAATDQPPETKPAKPAKEKPAVSDRDTGLAIDPDAEKSATELPPEKNKLETLAPDPATESVPEKAKSTPAKPEPKKETPRTVPKRK
jgi:hypothetical protein